MTSPFAPPGWHGGNYSAPYYSQASSSFYGSDDYEAYLSYHQFPQRQSEHRIGNTNNEAREQGRRDYSIFSNLGWQGKDNNINATQKPVQYDSNFQLLRASNPQPPAQLSISHYEHRDVGIRGPHRNENMNNLREVPNISIHGPGGRTNGMVFQTNASVMQFSPS